jgi:hypothetical protein
LLLQPSLESYDVNARSLGLAVQIPAQCASVCVRVCVCVCVVCLFY